MCALARLCKMLASNRELTFRLDQREKEYDERFKIVFNAIREHMKPAEKPGRTIGFGSASKRSTQNP